MDNRYEQFKELEVPEDIDPSVEHFTKESLENEIHKEVNPDFIVLNFNSKHYRPTEINIHTVDLFYNYKPDFDWTFLTEEIDPWRRTCLFKTNFMKFEKLGANIIRSDGFLHKAHICENLTFFEDSYKILKDDGILSIKIIDMVSCAENLIRASEINNIKKIQNLEKIIFSISDPTGIYYNRTILTLKRLEYYLTKVGFKEIEKDEKYSDKYHMTVNAKK